jgi:hypothetical protein
MYMHPQVAEAKLGHCIVIRDGWYQRCVSVCWSVRVRMSLWLVCPTRVQSFSSYRRPSAVPVLSYSLYQPYKQQMREFGESMLPALNKTKADGSPDPWFYPGEKDIVIHMRCACEVNAYVRHRLRMCISA